MTASSVTGRGLGSAVGRQKGSEHMTLGAEKLIGPRVVAADTVTLVAGAATVVLPLLPGVVGDYVVTATSNGENPVGVTMAFSSNATTLTFAGTLVEVISYTIVKKGLAV